MSFDLSGEQRKQVEEWRSLHQQECPITYGGAIGGKYTWQFTPTSLGIVIKIVCACGGSVDVSDYDMW